MTACLRRIPLPTLVVAALLLTAATTAEGAPAVLHHDLSVVLRLETHALSAADRLTIRPDGAARISLALADSARVTRLSVGGRELPAGTLREGGIGFPVPEEDRRRTLSVDIAYTATFDDPVPADPFGGEDPGYGIAGTISPRGVFLGEEARWYPDLPGSRASFRLRVETKKGIFAVAPGKLLRRSAAAGVEVAEWETAHPLSGIALAAGAYRVREKNAGGIPLYTCFYPENDALSGDYLSAAAGFLDLYRTLFGPYPFEKFAVVENFFPTGYGFPSYTLLGSAVLRLPFIVETSLGHEIAHSWWGNGVLVDLRRGNWSEGLVTYVADHLYKERASGAAGRDYRLQLLRDYATLVPPEADFPLAEFTARSSPASRAVGYGKGAMVFHMARRRAGEKAFWGGLRALARAKLFQEASWDDFDRAFFGNRAASFFRQWVERSGAPELALEGVAAERSGNRWTVTGKLSQAKPYFELRVPLRLETEGRPVDAIAAMDGAEVPFALIAVSRPRRLLVDPDVDLFRRLHSSEVPPTVNGVRGSASLLVVAARGLPPDILEASGTLLAALGKAGSKVAREEETPPSALAGHDVLYLGVPGRAGYLPPLPRQLSIAGGAFTLEGRKYASAEDALFAVLPHPADRGRVAALFLPLSARAATEAGRKIPHYGKYSFLSFVGGRNRAKGTWDVGASPVVFQFPPGPRDKPRPQGERRGSLAFPSLSTAESFLR